MLSGIKHDNTKVYETVEVHTSQLFELVNRCESLVSSLGHIISDKIFPVTLSNLFPVWWRCTESTISMAQSPSLEANKPWVIHEIPRI